MSKRNRMALLRRVPSQRCWLNERWPRAAEAGTQKPAWSGPLNRQIHAEARARGLPPRKAQRTVEPGDPGASTAPSSLNESLQTLSSGNSENCADQVRALPQFRCEFTCQIPGLHRIRGIDTAFECGSAEIPITHQVAVRGLNWWHKLTLL